MISVMKTLNKIFTRRNNILFMILSLLISMVVTICLSVNYIYSEIYYSDYSSFPENYSYYYGEGVNSKDTMKELFPGMDYTTLISTYSSADVSMEISNAKFTLIGVDSDFLDYPMPNFNRDILSNTLQLTPLIAGEGFTRDDILAESKTILMNECYLQACNYQGEDIYINGVAFKLKGVLASPSTYKTYAGKYQLDVPIYIPYTTFYSLLGSEKYLSYTAVVETNGLRFEQFEGDEQLLSTKYLWDYKKECCYKELSQQTLPIILSLAVLSVVATFIVQFIMVRNKHNEIGIKRAIGASKSDIIYEFSSEFALVTFLSVVIGFAIGVAGTMLFTVRYCFIFNAPILHINLSQILLYLALYYSLMFFSSIGSVAIGANINISSIIVEER